MINQMNREYITTLLAEIAEHLPGAWDLEPFPDGWNLGGYLKNHATHAILTIQKSGQYVDRNKDKLNISGDVPRDNKGERPYLGYNVKYPQISVSASKGGSQIARDIERRLFPDYLPILDQALANIASHNAYLNKTQAMAQKIADLVKVKHDPDDKDISFYRSPYPIFHEKALMEARVSSDDVELKLQLDYETTIKVLKYLIFL